MAMTSLTSLVPSSLINISIVFLLVFHVLPRPSYCLNSQPKKTYVDLVVAEETRLGSTPPTCHNKCNQCHPCMAVQVPTLPNHHRVDPARTQSQKPPLDSLKYYSSPASNRYSNYQPLGWKCRCDGNFYNP